MTKGIAAVAAALLGAWLALVATAWALQKRLVYFPSRGAVPPARAVLPGARELSLRTEDGLTLSAWFVPARGHWRGPAVLVFNGNAGDRGDRAPLAEALSREGSPVMLFDYRGYGGNAGEPGEEGLAADARAALRALEEQPEVDRAWIAYLGESLGAAVAVRLATERPPAALVLRSPFTSLPEVGAHHYPFLPVRWLLRERYPSIERIGRAACPLLVVAGERDSIVPVGMSRRLFDAAREPKELLTVPGADHNDYELSAGPRFVRAVAEFVRRHAPASP